jgi:hypothetical protein
MVTATVVTLLVFAALNRATSDQNMLLTRRVHQEASLLAADARTAIHACTINAVQSGTYDRLSAETRAVLQSIEPQEWDITSVSAGIPVGATDSWTLERVFDKSITAPVYATENPYANPVDGTSLIGPRVEHLMASQVGLATTLSGDKAINRTLTINTTVVEVPSVEMQLISTEQAYDSDGSATVVELEGKALLNLGAKRTLADNFTATSDSFVYVAAPIIGTTSGLRTAAAKLPPATWGTRDTARLAADLTSETNLPAAEQFQNYPIYVTTGLASAQTVTWEDPAAGPVSLPAGVSFVGNYNGGARLVIDLENWIGVLGLFVRCGELTKDLGIVIKGGSAATATPCIIATNGRVTLLGDNARAVIVSSSYAGGHAVLSSAYAGVPGNAVSSSWRGYLMFPVDNLSLMTSENWTGQRYTVQGTLLFKGGTINGVPRLRVQSDDVTKASFESAFLNSDRFLLMFSQLSDQ